MDAFALPEDNPAFQDARRLAEGRYIQHGRLDLEYELKLKQAEKEAQLARLEGEKTLVEADVAARANVTTAQGEAVRRSLEGITSVQEHQFATLDRMVDAGAAGGAGGAAAAGGRTRRIRCSAAAAAAEGRSKREPAFLQGFACGPKGPRRSKK